MCHKTHNQLHFEINNLFSADGGPKVFVASKNKSGLSKESLMEVEAILKKNEIAISSLKTFESSSCFD